jgi:hypothetical protein
VAGDERIARLDDTRRDRARGSDERDRLHADAELVDDPQEDQRQDDGLRVVDRMGDGQQPQRPTGTDRRRGGWARSVGGHVGEG